MTETSAESCLSPPQSVDDQIPEESEKISRRPSSGRNQRGQILGSKGARTRQAIIDATYKMICDRSFRDISAVDISKQAGVAVATLYTYFKDVTAIIVALAEAVSAKTPDMRCLMQTSWDQPEALDSVIRVISAHVDHNIAYFPLIRLRNHMADEGDERLARIRSQSARPVIELLTHQIITIGKFNDASTFGEAHEVARRTAGLLVGMIDRLTVLIVQNPYRDYALMKTDYIEAASRIVLAAVNAPFPVEQGPRAT